MAKDEKHFIMIIPRELHDQIRIGAMKENKSMKEFVVEAVMDKIDKAPTKEKVNENENETVPTT